MTSTPVASATANPFVGPKALTEEDPLFGRGVELKTLHAMLIAERIVLLYSPSGAGKTSLLHAGLKRLLVQDGFVVRPTIRVTHEVPPSLGDRPLRNRYVLSTLLSLEAGRSNELEPATLAEIRLDEYLATTGGTSSANGTECLLFDQFEELFTVDPIDMDEKEAFLEEVGQALRDRGRWAVFSMREEFVAHLDPYLKLIPTKLRTRFRLDLLRPEPALQAIQGPAREAGVEFSAEAASLVVDDLRTVLVQRGTAAVSEKGPTVEPVQLQVVCHRLWTRLGDVTRVEPEHVRELGDVDNALRDFYDDIMREVAQRTGVSERAIRTWISDELVTEQGYRAQTQHGPAEDAEGRVLPALENAHLVRADRRRTTVWYELAHDRLVDPIKSSNAEWLEENLSVVQRGARLWDTQRRDDRALLVGQELEVAGAWAASHPDELSELEREFLDASHKEEARVVREQRSARRTRLLAIMSTVVSLAAIAGLIAAIWQWQQVKHEKESAERVEQAMAYFIGGQETLDPQWSDLPPENAWRQRLLLDRMALEAFPDDKSPPVFMLNGINSHLYQNHVQNSPPTAAFDPFGNTVAMSGNGQFLADLTQEGVRITDLDASEGDQLIPIEPVSQSMGPVSLALSQDGRLLAVAPSSGGIQLWDVARQAMLRELDDAPSGDFNDWQLKFSKSGDLLAARNRESGYFGLWNVNSGGLVTPPQLDSLAIHSFDISSTDQLAISDGQSEVRVFDITKGTEVTAFSVTGPEAPSSMSFDQIGERLVVTLFDEVVVFAIPTGDQISSVQTIPEEEAAFSISSEPIAGFRGTEKLLTVLAYSRAEEDLCMLHEWTVDGEPVDEVTLDCMRPVSISDDGERILSRGVDGWSVWSTEGEMLKTSAPPEGTVSAGGPNVARIDSDGRVIVRTLAGEDVYTSPSDRTFQRVVIDRDGDTIVASSGEDLVVIDVSTGEVQSTTILPWRPDRIATSDNARLVAIASTNGELLRWKARDDTVAELPHSGEITSLAVTGSGTSVVVAATDVLTIYADDGTTIDEKVIDDDKQVIDVATDPRSNAIATVVTHKPAGPSQAEADRSPQPDELLVWDDVEKEPRRIVLSLESPTALALAEEYVAVAAAGQINVYKLADRQLAGGFKAAADFGGDPWLEFQSGRTVAISISDTEQPTVASIISDGTTAFRFSLDREGIREGLESVSDGNWKALDDEECRRIAGIDCL